MSQAEWVYRPVRSDQVLDPEGRRVVIPGRPDVVVYRRDTPSYGRNGSLEMLREIVASKRGLARGRRDE